MELPVRYSFDLAHYAGIHSTINQSDLLLLNLAETLFDGIFGPQSIDVDLFLLPDSMHTTYNRCQLVEVTVVRTYQQIAPLEKDSKADQDRPVGLLRLSLDQHSHLKMS